MLQSTNPEKLSNKEDSIGVIESHCEWKIEQVSPPVDRSKEFNGGGMG